MRAWLCLSCLLVIGTVGCDFFRPDPLPPRGDEWVVDEVREREARRGGKCDHPRTFYRDRDGDGFGDPKESVRGCTPPDGYVENGEDCYDRNAKAHPGQTDAFATDRGDGSFDYDCDGKEERRLVSRAFCREKEDGSGCVYASGWLDRKIPRCGQKGRWKFFECVSRAVPKQQEAPEQPGANAAAPGSGHGQTPGPSTAASRIPGSTGPFPSSQPSEFVTVHHCRGRDLPWPKRQLCR